MYKIETQLKAEGIEMPFAVVATECGFAKNALLATTGFTPYTPIDERQPPLRDEFEPHTKTQNHDCGSVAGFSRSHHRLREIAAQ